MKKQISIYKYIIITLSAITLVFSSCKNKELINNDVVSNSTNDHIAIQKEDINSIIGAWEEHIPGQEDEYQGFILNENGSAKSINMASLKYMSWKVDSNKIRFIVESIGNHTSFIDTVFYTIESIDNNTMVLKDKDLTIKMKKKNE